MRQLFASSGQTAKKKKKFKKDIGKTCSWGTGGGGGGQGESWAEPGGAPGNFHLGALESSYGRRKEEVRRAPPAQTEDRLKSPSKTEDLRPIGTPASISVSDSKLSHKRAAGRSENQVDFQVKGKPKVCVSGDRQEYRVGIRSQTAARSTLHTWKWPLSLQHTRKTGHSLLQFQP